MSSGDRIITEESVKEILTDYGFRVPSFAFVTNQEDACKRASEIGFPLVAKVVSPEILHKANVNGVKVGIKSEEEVKQVFNDMYMRLSKQYSLKGILLEKMVPPGVELIIGLQNDQQFGPVIMVGLGGVYTEILNDVSFRVLPITKNDAIQMIEDLKAKQILNGFRGSEPIDKEMISDLLVNIGKLGVEMSPYYESVDFNPLIVYAKDYFLVDGKIMLRESPKFDAISAAQPNSSYMNFLFNPTSVAVIGATPEIGKIGNSVLESVVKHGYKGKVFPVNDKGDSEIMGMKAYKSLEEITEPIDAVLVTVDLKFVPDLLKSCANKKIHNMIIYTGGGKERGKEGATIEQNLKALGHEFNVRIIGPNCIGMFNGGNHLDCVFQGHKRMIIPRNGHVAFVSQSGTIAAAFLEFSSQSFGVSKMISYGNRSDVDEADLIWYLSEDPQTKVIGLYFEGLEDGRKFISAAKKVIKERKRPIVVFKSNRTIKAAKQSTLHNGTFASSFNVMRGALDQAGIISVDSYEELTASLKALASHIVPKGNRVAMVTNGGAAVVAALDHIERLGLHIAEISEPTKKAFEEYYPPTYVTGNPCDLTAVANSEDYKFAIQRFIEDPNVDIVMSWFVPWFVFEDNSLGETIVDALATFEKQNKKPILVGAMGGPFTQKISSELEDKNVPVYHSILKWMTAAGALAKWSKEIEQKGKQIDMVTIDNLTTSHSHKKERINEEVAVI